MIDFLNHGAVKTFISGDEEVNSMKDSFETVVQFIPVGGNRNEVRSNLNAMLSILDQGLADMLMAMTHPDAGQRPTASEVVAWPLQGVLQAIQLADAHAPPQG